ncbi:MAG: FeoA family protein [Armatimonadota bacterium]|nr:FeoA family protein [Armatimonadota bacterium]
MHEAVARTLSSARAGCRVRLGVPQGVDHDVLRELWAMRLLPGETVTVVAVLGRSGPVLVQGAGGIFALGRRLAERLPAETLPPEAPA